ncbi:uncharacterized protein pall isoform X1 [Bemisia tabaci]|uniref:uncharacterized protein pall isoform X1 n=1 Tax=Bemisia tabaci TaxID=7038 RepID=UPI003B289706
MLLTYVLLSAGYQQVYNKNSDMSLLELPDVALEHIFSFLTYDEVAQKRIVCRKFNEICSFVLNRGFHKVELYHRRVLKAFKALLPRRESGRRTHPLARHCDMLVAIETRLSMLSMTFMKYIELKQCCFIPGKVIDETWNVLRLLTDTDTSSSLPRTQEALQELRDLSSMAMEHFDEKVAPALKQKSAIRRFSVYCDSPVPSDIICPHSEIGRLRLQINRLRQEKKKLLRRDFKLKKKLDLGILKADFLSKKMNAQRKYQNSINAFLLARIKQQENEMNELKQRIHEAGHWKDVIKSNLSTDDVSANSSSNNMSATSAKSVLKCQPPKCKTDETNVSSDNSLEFCDDFQRFVQSQKGKKRKRTSNS